MTNEELKEAISQVDPDAVLIDGPQYPEVTLTAGRLHEVCLMLKSSDITLSDYLFCVTGLDYPDYFEIVYHLESTVHQHVIVVKVRTENRENPFIDSVGDIWPTALSHEREIHDLLGVTFKNNHDMRRLFLEDDWEFPLRKDYVDPIRIVER